MDNVYRRDHEMPYIADDAVTSQQKETKKAIREYNETMPFELEKGMECLERAGTVSYTHLDVYKRQPDGYWLEIVP